jgi:hypothetical protein
MSIMRLIKRPGEIVGGQVGTARDADGRQCAIRALQVDQRHIGRRVRSLYCYPPGAHQTSGRLIDSLTC